MLFNTTFMFELPYELEQHNFFCAKMNIIRVKFVLRQTSMKDPLKDVMERITGGRKRRKRSYDLHIRSLNQSRGSRKLIPYSDDEELKRAMKKTYKIY